MGKTLGRYVLPNGKTTDDYWEWKEKWETHGTSPKEQKQVKKSNI